MFAKIAVRKIAVVLMTTARDSDSCNGGPGASCNAEITRSASTHAVRARVTRSACAAAGEKLQAVTNVLPVRAFSFHTVKRPTFKNFGELLIILIINC